MVFSSSLSIRDLLGIRHISVHGSLSLGKDPSDLSQYAFGQTFPPKRKSRCDDSRLDEAPLLGQIGAFLESPQRRKARGAEAVYGASRRTIEITNFAESQEWS